MFERLTFIDLETTGFDARADAIIEFGAVRLEGDRITERFSQLCNPGWPIPFCITHLTGISDADVVDAPGCDEALERFLEFIGDDVCVAHNASFDKGFLDVKSGYRFGNTVLDTLELSRVLLPMLENHDLETLRESLDLGRRDDHRATVDAEICAQLWLALLGAIENLKLPTLERITTLLSPTEWSLKGLFLDGLLKRANEALLQRPDDAEMLQDFSRIIARRKKTATADDDDFVPEPLDLDTMRDVFGNDGPFARTLLNYEHRPEQVRMATAVADAFNNATHLMVEAGTGTGKSMAYLVPAVQWAMQNRCQVVIATYTKALQEQLFFKDVPLLRKTLGAPFKAATIKGRTNYICVRKLMRLIEEADRELTDRERIQLLPVLTWLEQTETGDIAENSGVLVAKSRDMWPRLTSTGIECFGRRCRFRRNCFLQKARALALSADVVVTNHAVVFAELSLDSVVIPEYSHVIFDEAHHLEDVATESLGVEISRWQVLRVLNQLYRPGRRGGRGLLTNILFYLRRGREAARRSSLEQQTERLVTECFDGVVACGGATEEFVTSVSTLFISRRDDATRLRYDAENRNADEWEGIFDAKGRLIQRLGSLTQAFDRLYDMLIQMKADHDFLYREESAQELLSHTESVREIIADVEFVTAGEEKEFVFWSEQTDETRGDYRLFAAPLDIGPKMKALLYDCNDTIVFSSATLAINGRFDFVRLRLGLDLLEPERVQTLSLGTSFDFKRQVLIAVPTFLPEPDYRSRDFPEKIAELMAELHAATGGRGLVLFTSYAMLDQVYPRVRDDLAKQNILVLGQGHDGSPMKLMRTFQNDISSVLLGTSSFWEGIDAPGETLSCLSMVKLPFAVFTDPLIKARCEQIEARGQSSFMNYSLPMAVLRFKQGFGRLVRSKTDFGAVIVCDKRVLTKRYGQQFLGALPTGYRSFAGKESLVRAVARFLENRGG